MDDVAQCRIPVTIGACNIARDFIITLASNVVQDFRPFSGVAYRRLLRRRKTGPAKRHLAAILFHRHYISLGIEVLQVHARRGATAPPFGRRVDHALAAYRKSKYIAAPFFSVIVDLEYRFIPAGQVEVGNFQLRQIASGLVRRGKCRCSKNQFSRHGNRQHSGNNPKGFEFHDELSFTVNNSVR